MQSRIVDFVRAAEAFPVPIVITRLNGEILLINCAAEMLFGYSRDELVGKNIDALLCVPYEDVQSSNGSQLRRPHGQWIGVAFQLAGRRKDGGEFPIEIGINYNRTDGGMLILNTVRDAGTNDCDHDETRELRAQYRALFESAGFGMFRTSSAGRIIEANPAFCAMLGYDSLKELKDAGIAFNFFRYALQRSELLQEAQRADRISGFDAAWRNRDGKRVAVRLSGHVMRNGGGEPSGFAMFAEDVTYCRALEEQLRQSQKLETIARLANSIVHDFNNLIAVVSTQSEVMLELEDLESIRRETQVILNTADRAAALTGQLLAYSRKQRSEPKVINLNAVLRNMDQMLERLLPEDVEFNTILAEDLGHILADPSQIEQVVMNLVVNARDAMPKGGLLSVETSNVQLDDLYARDHLDVTAGPYVALSVSDTGVGMTADVRARLFEPFFTTKPAGQGTGLGLSTVYSVVKQISGHVWLYSQPGNGTTFKLYFPRVVEIIETASPKASRAAIPGPIVLLVEDEDRLRRSVKHLLEKAGYSVLAASNGLEALRILRETHQSIDLVLTDVGLPYIRGPELVRKLKMRQPHIKAVYMSGFGPDAIRADDAARLYGSFVQKPFRKEVLLGQLEHALNCNGNGNL